MPLRPSQKFETWLRNQLAKLPPGSRLPTGKELAATWNISESTTRAILRKYRSSGKLALIPGRGAFVPDEGGDPEPHAAPARSSADSIVEFITDSIRKGDIKLGEALPSIKYMTLQFGVAPMTVVRAYRTLRRHGMITQVGKTHWAGTYGSIVRGASRKTVYLFNAESDFREVFKEGWLAPAYQKLERELLAYGFSLVYRDLSELSDLTSRWLGRDEMPDGIILYKISGDRLAHGVRESLMRLRKDRRRRKMPVLVDWREGNYRVLPPGMIVLSRGNVYTTRAKAIAEFAVRKGCDSLVFFFDETRDPFGWFLPFVRIRSELTQLSSSVGFVTAVRPSPLNADKRAFLRKLYTARNPQQITMILSKYTLTTHTELEREMRIVGKVEDLLDLRTSRTLLLVPHDDQAVTLVEASRKRGIRIPRDMAILSFENDPHYYVEGISCCIPDWERMGYLMAHAIIGDFPVARTSKGFLRVMADILERSTTG